MNSLDKPPHKFCLTDEEIEKYGKNTIEDISQSCYEVKQEWVSYFGCTAGLTLAYIYHLWKIQCQNQNSISRLQQNHYFFKCVGQVLESKLNMGSRRRKICFEVLSQSEVLEITRCGNTFWLRINHKKLKQIEEIREKMDNPIQFLKKLSYGEYLESDHWKRTRTKALRRAGYKCQLCNKKTDLQVHHNNYVRLGNELPTDLITLCKWCHSKHHDKLPPEPNGPIG